MNRDEIVMRAGEGATPATQDHPFQPRAMAVRVHVDDEPERFLRPNPALCQLCRLAEAAHTATTTYDDFVNERRRS